MEALTIRAPMDGQLTALDAEVGQSKAPGAVLGQVNSADRFKLTAAGRRILSRPRRRRARRRCSPSTAATIAAKVAKVYPQVTNGTFKVDFYFDGAAPTDIHVGQAIDLKVELGGAVAAR